MYCLGCGYNLHWLTENRCTECGRKFDPGDPRSFASSGERLPIPFWVPALAAAYPVLPLALLLATWVAAVVSLGHVPEPDGDYPQSINATVSLPHSLSLLAVMGLEVYGPALAVLLIAYTLLGRGTRRGERALCLLVLSLTLFGCSVLAFCGDQACGSLICDK